MCDYYKNTLSEKFYQNWFINEWSTNNFGKILEFSSFQGDVEELLDNCFIMYEKKKQIGFTDWIQYVTTQPFSVSLREIERNIKIIIVPKPILSLNTYKHFLA